MKRLSIALGALALTACSVSVETDGAEEVSTSAATQVAEALYAAFAAGDMDTIAALLVDDTQWIEAEGGPYEEGNPYVGLSGVGEGVFGPIGAAYSDFAATPERYTAQGDRVVVEGRYTGTNNANGETLDAQFVHVITTNGEQITAFQQYTDTYQWRRLEGSLGE